MPCAARNCTLDVKAEALPKTARYRLNINAGGAMAFTWAAFTPHPPIIVPEVGRGREKEAAVTLDGVEKLMGHLKEAARPGCILLLSPHQPHVRGSLFLNSAARIRGSLARFGAPGAGADLETPLDFLKSLARHLEAKGIPLTLQEAENLSPDQGSLVPLYYLEKFYGKLPPVILGNALGLDMEGAIGLGEALGEFDDGLSWALLASGDLSHRLTPDAPAGYNSAGRVFDDAVVSAFEKGNSGLLTGLSGKTLEGAGECGLRSALAFLGLCAGPVEVLSYEGPFGVGYCNAFWKKPENGEAPGAGETKDGGKSAGVDKQPGAEPPDAAAGGNESRGHPYPELARLTVKRYLAGESVDTLEPSSVNADSALWSGRQACFVSIKKRDGSLRGCIGTILPSYEDIGREIINNAVAAATKDPRFPAMNAAELENVVFSVDVLSKPEEVADISGLDPKKWGIILTKGPRRGLLLPDLEGVDTVARQIDIAARKAGIKDLTGTRVDRFSVTRYKEGPGNGRGDD